MIIYSYKKKNIFNYIIVLNFNFSEILYIILKSLKNIL